MRTRYEMLEKAGDLLDSAQKLLDNAFEPDLAMDVRRTMAKAYVAQEAAWDVRQAEPELEMHS